MEVLKLLFVVILTNLLYVEVDCSFVRDKSMLWINGTIPYRFLDDGGSYTTKEKNLIRSVMKKMELQLGSDCIKFNEDVLCEECLQFDKIAPRCTSQIGRMRRPSKSTLGLPNCFENDGALILHELGHVLGRVHEETRPDRDQFLDIQFENVHFRARSAINVRTSRFGDTYQTPFDFYSVMMMSNSPCRDNLTCVQIKEPYQHMRENIYDGTIINKLSPVDIVEISLAYNCSINPAVQLEYEDYLLKVYKTCYELSHSKKVTRLSCEQFKFSHQKKILVENNNRTVISIGRFKDFKLDRFGVSVRPGVDLEVTAGTWRKGKLVKGFQLFPKNMTIHYFNSKPSKDLHMTVTNLDTDDILAKCKTSAKFDTNCNIMNGSLFDTFYDYNLEGMYEGQLKGVHRRDPVREGFGHLFDRHTGHDYLGFWKRNSKHIFGVEKLPLSEFYAGQFWKGTHHGAGASISFTKTYRTIFVSDYSFGQTHGPGVFFYPDGLIFFGMFRNRKKQGQGVWINQKNMEIFIR